MEDAVENWPTATSEEYPSTGETNMEVNKGAENEPLVYKITSFSSPPWSNWTKPFFLNKSHCWLQALSGGLIQYTLHKKKTETLTI